METTKQIALLNEARLQANRIHNNLASILGKLDTIEKQGAFITSYADCIVRHVENIGKISTALRDTVEVAKQDHVEWARKDGHTDQPEPGAGYVLEEIQTGQPFSNVKMKYWCFKRPVARGRDEYLHILGYRGKYITLGNIYHAPLYGSLLENSGPKYEVCHFPSNMPVDMIESMPVETWRVHTLVNDKPVELTAFALFHAIYATEVM